jgi:hypothetical protein
MEKKQIKDYKEFCQAIPEGGVSKMQRNMPRPKALSKNLDDIRSGIPEGGLLNPKLRQMEKFDAEKLHKKLFGK